MTWALFDGLPHGLRKNKTQQHFRLETVSSYATLNDALMFKTFYRFSLIEKKRGVFVEEGGGGRNILLLYTMPFSV